MTFYIPGTEEQDLSKVIMSLQQLAKAFPTTSAGITHTAAGAGAVGRPVLDALDDVFNAKDYGAKGDFSVPDTPAIQRAITAAELTVNGANSPTVWIPPGSYQGNNQLVVSKGIRIAGPGTLVQTVNAPYIKIDTSGGDIYGLDIDGLNFLTSVSGSRTNEPAIAAAGGGNLFHSKFTNLDIMGCFYGFNFALLTGTCQQTVVENFRVRNSGANNTEYFWYDPTGITGTSTFTSGLVGCHTAGFVIGDGVTNGAGDALFTGIQFSGNGIGIQMTGKPGVYGTNVKVSQCGFDAGITTGVKFTNMNNFSLRSINWGGAAQAYDLINCFDYHIEGIAGLGGFGGNFDTRDLYVGGLLNDPTTVIKHEWAMNHKSGLAATATVPLFTIDLSNNSNTSVHVKIDSRGFQQGTGEGIVSGDYILFRNGGTISITTNSNVSVGALAHSLVISGATVIFNAVSTGGAGSAVSSRIEVNGWYNQIVRN